MFLRLLGLFLLGGIGFALPTQEKTTTLELTGRDLDLGLDGPGFYRVDIGNGEYRYTRDGRFTTNDRGELVTAAGFRVNPSPNIGVGALRITVDLNGMVEVLAAGSDTPRRRGQILLVSFENPDALVSAGGGLFWATEAAGAEMFFAPTKNGTTIRQAFREREVIGQPVNSGAVTITLAMEAYARGTEVELGEIAQIVGAEEALVKTVQAIELGYAPAPGYSRLFRADRILATVKREVPLADVRFAGQRAVRVFPAVEQISGDEIVRAANEHLLESYADREMAFELRDEVVGVDVPAGAEKREFRVRIVNEVDSSGFLSVPVEVLVDGVRYRTVWTTWTVTVFATRPVLAQRVRAGQVLRPSMFVRRRVEVKAGEKKGLAAEMLNGSVALHDLIPGQSVTPLDVRRPVVVQLGESIFLRVRNGPIEAKVPAIALEAGAVGDRVRVRVSEGAQELVATIESRDICTIDLSR